MSPRAPVDDLDARLLALLLERPQVGVLGASRELDVARGTVQARLDRLVQQGVISSLAPTLDPAAMGYPVTAFCTLAIQQQAGHEDLLSHLQGIPEVLEVHTITGDGDLMVRVVARDNPDLQRVIDLVVSTGVVTRTSTVIALAELMAHRTNALVGAAVERSPSVSGRSLAP
ncbi:Lrp/AsnC family transcriptional regulator [Luteipulveratus sp. YIM 133132]|uniref:Lrp/AsnC family transcriptional regulator n=1 Tax=Luteipulveratus flavus TaxID=3031728 RepID=UPI0023B07F3E|nr:Lrp/AsnC family transcriptional regulator [Luteipulveratus sp. YIM 133132]MDE9367794.1 Lrp/AsnC family transcriptional regulator [Luteipulveratus sp. YIM 133132]